MASQLQSPFFACTLYSSSDGNCTYIRTPDTQFLIDAGKNAKALTAGLAAIGTDPSQIDAIFITHEHRDHISALPILMKHYNIPIYMVKDSYRRIQHNLTPAVITHIQPQSPLFHVNIGYTEIRSFVTSHDSQMSVGYRITYTKPDTEPFSIGYATDVGIIDTSVRMGLYGCKAVILEANHDIEMLMGGPYPYYLKERILSRFGHLSNHDSATFAAELVEHGTRSFLLAHLSTENNLPSLALADYRAALGDESIPVCTASPCKYTELCLEGLYPC